MFVVSAIVFFIVPMIIVTVLYILIALELRRSSKMNNAIAKQQSPSLNQLTSLMQPPQICAHHHSNHRLWPHKPPHPGWSSAEPRPLSRADSGQVNANPLIAGSIPASSLNLTNPAGSQSLVDGQPSNGCCRPSSAIGNERPASRANQRAELQRPFAPARKSLLWSPFSWSNLLPTGQQQSQQPRIALWPPCQCSCQAANISVNNNRHRQPRRQQSDQSVLLGAASNRARPKVSAPKPGLSYHESLMQHHVQPSGQDAGHNSQESPNQMGSAQATSNCQARQSEISIGPNSVTSVSVNQQQDNRHPSPNLNQHPQQPHQCNLLHTPTCHLSHLNHYRQQQWPAAIQRHQHQSRRLAAASSKKSVIRMLGK